MSNQNTLTEIPVFSEVVSLPKIFGSVITIETLAVLDIDAYALRKNQSS